MTPLTAYALGAIVGSGLVLSGQLMGAGAKLSLAHKIVIQILISSVVSAAALTAVVMMSCC